MDSDSIRLDPLGDIGRFESCRNMEELFGNFGLTPGARSLEMVPRIRVDISETDHVYLVKADIPSVRKESIKVSIDGSQISIRVEAKKEQQDSKDKKPGRTECYCGEQYRSFTLAQDIDDAKAEVRYQDGVLELSLPKKLGSSGKQLSIQ
jgi:HSP20 family protein